MDWDKLRIFHAVAKAGSLTHAGDALHLSQSAVSRQIRNLEESLDTTLFHRHARGLILTEQGELLYKATESMSSLLERTNAQIQDSENEVFGELRVTTTTGFGTLWLPERLSSLFEKYPNLKIDLKLDERVLDLPMREADVAIRMKEPSQADLIRRRLMNVNMRLYASREYVERFGAPKTTADLKDHRLLAQASTSTQANAAALWIDPFLASDHVSHLTVNNYFGVLQSVIHGLGIGVLPDYVTHNVPELLRILPDQESAPVPVFLAYPEELRHSKRVAAFRDFVIEEIAIFRKNRLEETIA